MNRQQIRSTAVAAGAASLLLLTAAAPAVAAEPAAGAPAITCGELSADQALETWAPTLAPPSTEDTVPVLSRADTSTYDECATLSWIVVPYGEPDGRIQVLPGAPHAVMLFHEGEYLGTATSEPVPWEPHVQDDYITPPGQISITYPYMEEGQTHATIPLGRAVSLFLWDFDTESLVHEGEFPPGL